MDRKLLLTIGAAAGALILVCILFMPMAGKGEYSQNFIESGTIGIVFLLVGICAAGYAILLFLGKSHFVGPDEARVVNSAFGFFALGAFLGLAAMIAGTDGLMIGFWLYWIACLVGGFAMLLTANPALAKKLAEATKEKADDKPAADDAKDS